MFDTMTASLIGLGFLGIFSYYCYRLMKTHPKEDLGQLLSWKAIYHNESILMILLIGVAAAEGITAATTYALDPTIVHSNIVARMIQHLCLTGGGIICTFTMFRDFSAAWESKLSWQVQTARIFIIFVVSCIAIGAPIANITLLAGNLKQESVLSLFFYSWFCSNETWAAILVNWGYDHNWSPWATLQPAIKGIIWTAVFHVALALLESLRSMASETRRNRILFDPAKENDKPATDEEKEKPAPKEGDRPDEMEAERRQYDKIDDTLRYLFLRIGYEGAKLRTMVETAKKIIDTTHRDDKKKATNMVAIASKLKIDGETIKNVSDADEKRKKNKDLDEKIHKFFTASKSNTGDSVGLSMTLKKN